MSKLGNAKTPDILESIELFGDLVVAKTTLPIYVHVGDEFKTVGGWVARIVYVTSNRYCAYAVHRPDDPIEESPPIMHDWQGRSITSFAVNAPPTYNSAMPSDIIFTEKVSN